MIQFNRLIFQGLSVIHDCFNPERSLLDLLGYGRKKNSTEKDTDKLFIHVIYN